MFYLPLVAKTGEPINFKNYAEAFQRWFDVRAVRVGDAADDQIALIFNDVIDRREAEKRLRVSEAIARESGERVQLALEAGAIIGTWHWDMRSDEFAVGEAFARALISILRWAEKDFRVPKSLQRFTQTTRQAWSKLSMPRLLEVAPTPISTGAVVPMGATIG